MAKPTIIFGVLLILLGLVGYFGTPAAPAGAAADDAETAAAAADETDTGTAKPAPAGRSVTALIPAFVGGLLVLCGLLALNEQYLKHAMHAAAMVGLLGAIAGAGRGTMGLVKLAGGNEVNMRSLFFVWAMAALCIAFVVMCVRSFIAARKRREAGEANAAA